MSLNIIGISSHFHDSACCLLRDGVLVAAAQEERFTRIKHDPSLPVRAFRYCLSEGGLGIQDIDCVAYYENPAKKLGRQLWVRLCAGGNFASDKGYVDLRRQRREFCEALGYTGRVEFAEHHQSHAASSYYYSGFNESAVFTVDGVGEWATTAYGLANGDGISIFEEVDFPDSLGLLYSTITNYLGFSVNDGEYKVMGLAPYGKPVLMDHMHKLLQSLKGGQFQLNLEYFDFTRTDRMYSERLLELFGHPARQRESEIEPFHVDVARSLQATLEEILVEKATYLHRVSNSENLCMAGGVALNCVANSKILRNTAFKRLFVQPAAGDAGGALGAAALAHVRITGARPLSTPLEDAYLGPGCEHSDVTRLLRAAAMHYEDHQGEEGSLVAAVAERLASGKVIGWCQGRMEFGPRALGARSILADPRDHGMRDRINALVKMRESFRPFAPVVLESRAPLYFDIDHPSPFMLETCQTHSSVDLPAITHVDGSARLQTVNYSTNRRLACLLAEFERQTGCPVLLNTSFNLRDEPIVCTPLDAFICFVRSKIDALVLGDFVIDRSAINPAWPVLLDRTIAQYRPAISHEVYTFF
jgi:carbamoyltransferase